MKNSTCGNAYCNCSRCEPVEETCPCKCSDRDIQVDLFPAACRNPVVWGTVYDQCSRPLNRGLIQLLQCTEENEECCLVVGQTYSDCNGHYEIPLPSSCRGRYRIEVSDPYEANRQIRGKNHVYYY